VAKPKIAIFHNHPQCSIQCTHGIIRALSNDYDIDCFNKDQIRTSYFKKYKLIAFPGGIGDSDTWHKLLEPTADLIREQVLIKKIPYLGICMGAYWAGPYYYNLLDSVQTVQYIRRPGSEILRSYGTVAEVVWNEQQENMFFYDGCSFLSNHNNFTTIARYANGDAAAIIQNNLGLIGPHPESDIYWYDKKVLKPYWHEYRHHKLLADFVRQLVK